MCTLLDFDAVGVTSEHEDGNLDGQQEFTCRRLDKKGHNFLTMS